jgi:hypothetical protein
MLHGRMVHGLMEFEDCYELRDFVWKGERDASIMVTETH